MVSKRSAPHLFLALATGIYCLLAVGLPVLAAETATTEIVTPPICVNNLGEAVTFLTRQGRPGGMAAGMARRDTEGTPVIYRSNFSETSEACQMFIDRHECAHHQVGDIDRPHPPRNSPDHLMNESISDCISIMRLRDEEGYDQTGFDKVADAMSHDMAKIGFPPISINSRLSNIRNCFSRGDTAQEFVEKILEQRGLVKP